ncbi:MAG TPA: DUF3105 domain-containing protein [Jatrophihabitans sp.]|uniref:DUF3105 domain-containing protein n=1 Tax=Jatrophihabitans sp. TaxID=1932789 RepID=UPI002EE15FAC
MKAVTIRRLGWWLVTVGLLCAAVAGAVKQQLPRLTGSAVGSAPASDRSEPCLPGTPIAILKSPHVSTAALRTTDYNSVPPTSGPHFGIAPSPGIYDTPLQPGAFVHAEEHGHVVFAYSPSLPAAQVSALKDIAKAYSGDVLMTPYPPLADGLALAAWGRLQRFEQVDRPGIERFIDALAGRYDHRWTGPPRC